MSELTYPLLPQQRRYLTRALPEENYWNQSVMLAVSPEVDLPLLRTAFLAVINRHAGLRAVLSDNDRAESGIVLPPLHDIDIPVFDVRDLPESEQAAAVTRESTKLQSSLSMTDSVMCRVAYFIMAGAQRRFLMIFHHFVCDGLSLQIVVADLDRAVRRLREGKDLSAPGSHTTAIDFARWLADYSGAAELRGQLPLWLHAGRRADPVALELPGPNTMSTTDTVEVTWDKATTSRIVNEALPRLGTGINEAFLTAAVATLQGAGKDRSVRSNLIGHGRRGLPGQPNLAKTVGWISTRYPISVQLDTTASFTDQLAVTAATLADLPLDGAGFAILRYLTPDHDVRDALAALGEADITVNYLGRLSSAAAGTGPFALASESAGPEETLTGLREHTHGIDVLIHNDELRVIWYYSTTQFHRSTIEGYAADLLDRIRHGLAI